VGKESKNCTVTNCTGAEKCAIKQVRENAQKYYRRGYNDIDVRILAGCACAEEIIEEEKTRKKLRGDKLKIVEQKANSPQLKNPSILKTPTQLTPQVNTSETPVKFIQETSNFKSEK